MQAASRQQPDPIDCEFQRLRAQDALEALAQLLHATGKEGLAQVPAQGLASLLELVRHELARGLQA